MLLRSSCPSCCQIVKVKDFESNSQHLSVATISEPSCCQIVKVKDFESNSQLSRSEKGYRGTCCQIVKVKDFESNSQQIPCRVSLPTHVVRLSKLKISKAIHNSFPSNITWKDPVVRLSKLKISKAIHNALYDVGTMEYLLSDVTYRWSTCWQFDKEGSESVRFCTIRSRFVSSCSKLERVGPIRWRVGGMPPSPWGGAL